MKVTSLSKYEKAGNNFCDILMCVVFIFSFQRIPQPVLHSKAVVTRGLKKMCLPERGDKQQLAGLLGVSRYWQLHSAEKLLLCVAFISNCRLLSEFVATIWDIC